MLSKRQILLVLATGFPLLVACTGGSAGTPGNQQLGGQQPAAPASEGQSGGMSYGSAKATVTAAGQSYSFEEGTCIRGNDRFSLTIGPSVTNPDDPKNHSFGITMPPSTAGGVTAVRPTGDGTYKHALIVVSTAGKTWTAGLRSAMGSGDDVSVTLKNNRSAGDFTGSDAERGAISGSFTC